MFQFNNISAFTGGGGLSTTTANGGFDFSQIGGAITSGSTSEIGQSVGAGATLAVDSLLFGGLPLSTALTNILGVDLAGNISNVLNYGLNSWGATSNPDKMQANIENRLTPHALGLIEAYRVDTQKGLNDFSKWIHALIGNAENFRHNHAKAGSSKVAYDKVIKWAKELRTKALFQPIQNLKNKGVIITTTNIDYNVSGTFYIDKTYPNTSRSYSTPQYQINQASLEKALEEPINELQDVEQTKSTASFGGIFGLVIGGLIMKKLF